MKKQALCLLLCLTLVFSFGSYAYAADAASNGQAKAAAVVSDQRTNAAADSLAATDAPYFLVNGVAVSDPGLMIENHITYVTLQTVINALFPSAPVTWDGQRAIVSAPGIAMTARPGDVYVEANGRYLYVMDGVKSIDGRLLVPIRTMAQVLGGYVVWDADSGVAALYSGTSAIAHADQFYNAEDLNWLSHIISAESGGEPLQGKLGVGTVIMNRVASPQFPSTVHGVVFDRRNGTWQFTPAGSGSIQRTPNAESVIAAKLCLEGVRVGGNSMYFVNLRSSPNCWASRNRPLVATIGRHTFFA